MLVIKELLKEKREKLSPDYFKKYCERNIKRLEKNKTALNLDLVDYETSPETFTATTYNDYNSIYEDYIKTDKELTLWKEYLK
jgi:hypothetical protein